MGARVPVPRTALYISALHHFTILRPTRQRTILNSQTGNESCLLRCISSGSGASVNLALVKGMLLVHEAEAFG